MSEPSKDLKLRLYREMLRLRTLDERMMTLQRQGRVGFYGAATGQEAVPIGAAAALEDGDWVFPALREGAVMLYRGYDLVTYICQVFGNGGDVLRGRQMPSHYADKSVHQVSWSSCIGSQLPQATGAALAAKHAKDGNVIVAFSGDGGTSTADFHYAMNFAGVWKVPLVLICQNNHWSISLPTKKQTASDDIAVKALAYGMRGIQADGNDVLTVYEVTRQALARARRGDGPTFIEFLTYRIGAHSSSDDPSRYRDEKEVEAWRARDPIEHMYNHLLEEGLWGPERNEQLLATLDKEVRSAVKEAEAKASPGKEELFTDVYSTPPWNLQEQRDDFFQKE